MTNAGILPNVVVDKSGMLALKYGREGWMDGQTDR